MSIYPRKAAVKDAESGDISEAEMARRIIEAVEEGQVTVEGFDEPIPVLGESHGACTGPCLLLPPDANEIDPKTNKPLGRGSDQVGLFNRVWKEILVESNRMAAVNPLDHETAESYLAALDERATHLVGKLYCDGVLAKAGVADFDALRASLAA